MARTRRRAADTDTDTDAEAEWEGRAEWQKRTDKERKANKAEREAWRRRGNLVQTALMGEVADYVIPDHTAGENFPGPQPSTTQLSLFETGFKRKSGQMSLFETGFKRIRV